MLPSATPADGPRPEPSDVAPADLHRAGLGPVQPRQHSQQGRLPGARRSGDHRQPPGVALQGHVDQGRRRSGDGLVVDAHVGDSDDRHHRRRRAEAITCRHGAPPPDRRGPPGAGRGRRPRATTRRTAPSAPARREPRAAAAGSGWNFGTGSTRSWASQAAVSADARPSSVPTSTLATSSTASARRCWARRSPMRRMKA